MHSLTVQQQGVAGPNSVRMDDRDTAKVGSSADGTVKRMATVEITITLPEQQIEEIRKRVAVHESASISGFVQRAVQRALMNSSEFSAMVDQGLMETGGPLTPKEQAWARKVLSPQQRRARKTTPGKAA